MLSSWHGLSIPSRGQNSHKESVPMRKSLMLAVIALATPACDTTYQSVESKAKNGILAGVDALWTPNIRLKCRAGNTVVAIVASKSVAPVVEIVNPDRTPAMTRVITP